MSIAQSTPDATPNSQRGSIPDQLLEQRGIREEALKCKWQARKQGWSYPVCDFDGASIAHRFKNFDIDAKKRKYTWPNGRPSHCKYYIPPGTDLRWEVQQAGGRIYLASGEPDVLAFRSAGIRNVISWFGEDAPPPTLASDLQALGAREAGYLPDRDTTGERSAQKVARRLHGSGIALTVGELPSELGDKGDINDLWQLCRFDQAAFRARIEALLAAVATNPPPTAGEQADQDAGANPSRPAARLGREGGKGPESTVDWSTERAHWVQTVVLPLLDQAAPVQESERRRKRRHCPNPDHPDHHPSFAISYDRDPLVGIPVCSCGIQDERRPWDRVAEWVGAEPFQPWWKRERQHLYSAPAKREQPRTKTEGANAQRTPPGHRTSPKLPDPDTKQLTKDLADLILATDHFAQDSGGKLYVFKDGVYQPDGERFVRQRVKALLEDAKMSRHWSSHRANEVVAYIQVDAPTLWEVPPLDTLNVKNGLLDVKTSTLRPHSPDFLSPIQLPVEYVPGAYPHHWDDFCRSVLPPDVYEAGVHWQIVAWLMLPITFLQKALLLLGDGGNGKSRFLAGLRSLIGSDHVTALSLQKIEGDRFAIARLQGKLANTCPDLPSQHLEQTAVFKQLTGDDGKLTGEYKGKDSFELDVFARLVFSTNQPPMSRDNSEGFYRRWLVIPFLAVFTGSERIDSREIDTRLAAPEELSGVLNQALLYLPQVLHDGITETPSMKQALSTFRASTDPLAVWLDQETFPDRSAYVSKEALRREYNRVSGSNLSEQAFGRAFNRLRPHVQEKQRMWNGQPKIRVYVGIGCLSGIHKRID
jgi:P4 family phage/plasmid primase-like protien